jgi:hypothetical protein
MQIDAHVREAILAQPESAWTAAIAPDGQVRPGAEVCELTGWLDLHTWPAGTRAICRREDAHPGAQLRFTDHDGHRFQVFLTDQPDPDHAALELRHRQRARVEDRIRAAKATGLRNLPSCICQQLAVDALASASTKLALSFGAEVLGHTIRQFASHSRVESLGDYVGDERR